MEKQPLLAVAGKADPTEEAVYSTVLNKLRPSVPGIGRGMSIANRLASWKGDLSRTYTSQIVGMKCIEHFADLPHVDVCDDFRYNIGFSHAEFDHAWEKGSSTRFRNAPNKQGRSSILL